MCARAAVQKGEKGSAVCCWPRPHCQEVGGAVRAERGAGSGHSSHGSLLTLCHFCIHANWMLKTQGKERPMGRGEKGCQTGSLGWLETVGKIRDSVGRGLNCWQQLWLPVSKCGRAGWKGDDWNGVGRVPRLRHPGRGRGREREGGSASSSVHVLWLGLFGRIEQEAGGAVVGEPTFDGGRAPASSTLSKGRGRKTGKEKEGREGWKCRGKVGED